MNRLRGISKSLSPYWLLFSALAVVATLGHTLIDMHIGLWGESSEDMQFIQALNALGFSTLFAWWFVLAVLAERGDRWAMRSLLIFALVFAFFLNGLAALAAAPPPSAAFPYQDIAHVLSLVTGAIAALAVWGACGRTSPGGSRYLLFVTIAVVIVNQILATAAFIASS